MTIDENRSEFAGFPVCEYSSDEAITSPDSQAFRISIDWEARDEGKTFDDTFAAFVADPACIDVEALLIGDWGGAGEGDDSSSVVEALVSARERIPKVRALFLGEMSVEESEISWINQSDVSPLFEAFGNLEELWLRGGEGLSLGRPRHKNLQKLVIETGGMPATIVHEVISAEFPQLKHLELWLGDDGYGRNVRPEDIRQLITDGPCQRIIYLGLRDDCEADETAKLLAESGIPSSVEMLDLSLGTLGDEGASTIAESSWCNQLRMLDIHHHYVSPEVVAKLRTVVSEVNADDVKEPEEWDGQLHRYVAVSE